MQEKMVKFIKQSKEETEEGYLFTTTKSLIKMLEISEGKLKKVVQHALKKEILKFDEIKEVRIVVYTQERRLDIKHL